MSPATSQALQRLQGKVAIVTGSGRRKGLGFAIADRLASEGCHVVITDIGAPDKLLTAGNIGTTADMEEIAGAIRARGVEVLTVPCDVRNEADVARLIEATLQKFQRIDIVVNNAGVGYMLKPFLDSTLEEWNLVLDVNLKGVYLVSRYAAREMVRLGQGGRIINIASQAAKSGFGQLASYVASKHGLVGFTRSIAAELGSHGITANCVCPNHVTTDLGARQREYLAKARGQTIEEYMAIMRAKIPLGRPGLPEDTAAAVAFLASDDAVYITGEAMNVSGGEEMH